MSSGSLSDLSDALNRVFAAPHSKIEDVRPRLSAYLEKHSKIEESSSIRLQDELSNIYRHHVKANPSKLGPFASVLRALQPCLPSTKCRLDWLQVVVFPFSEELGTRKDEVRDVEGYALDLLVFDGEATDAAEKSRLSRDACTRLVKEYVSRTDRLLAGSDTAIARRLDHSQQQIETILVAFGRQRPKALFTAIDISLKDPQSRFSALQLLSAWLQKQPPHLYEVSETDVFEHLILCLMNDKVSQVVSTALQCLVMLLPHVPALIPPNLPRLFLIYSRCLCWEKFSESASQAQKDLVTDDRVRHDQDMQKGRSDTDLSTSNPNWTTLDTLPWTTDASTPAASAPELLTYFTYLYGLYPLNLMSYVRKPRKYLKNIDFPGVDHFDLDQHIIRTRTEQYQRAHILHPSFFNLTAEEELAENRWLKAEPEEVISECLGLCCSVSQTEETHGGVVFTQEVQPFIMPRLRPSTGMSMGSARTTNVPSPASIAVGAAEGIPAQEPASLDLAKTASQDSASIASPDRATPITSEEGRVSMDQLEKDDSVQGLTDAIEAASPDTACLQRELILLRNELGFERFVKAQHVAAIGHLKRERIRTVTMEAETATLINSNKALQKKLAEASRFNEKMQKEMQARKTHSRQSEEQLTAKVRTLRSSLANQESLEASLTKAKRDGDQLRQLLVESESREFRMRQEVNVSKGRIEELEGLELKVRELETRLEDSEHDHEARAQYAKMKQENLQRDLEVTKIIAVGRDRDRERSEQELRKDISELEAHLQLPDGEEGDSFPQSPKDAADLQQRVAESQKRPRNMMKAYGQVLQDLKDLKWRYGTNVSTRGINLARPGPDAVSRSYNPSRNGFDIWTRGYGHSSGSHAPSSLPTAFSNGAPRLDVGDKYGSPQAEPISTPPIYEHETRNGSDTNDGDMAALSTAVGSQNDRMEL